jgi:hypothetical protein
MIKIKQMPAKLNKDEKKAILKHILEESKKELDSLKLTKGSTLEVSFEVVNAKEV